MQGVISDWVVQGVISDWVVQGVISDWVVQGVISDWVVQGVISDWVVQGVISSCSGFLFSPCNTRATLLVLYVSAGGETAQHSYRPGISHYFISGFISYE